MTPYEKYWTDMREYFIAKAKSILTLIGNINNKDSEEEN